MNDLNATFKILKKQFPDYEDRPQQMEMADAVFECLKNNERLLVEAGTGVGKSFAYLIPAILSGKKTIVSTASIALQDQLVNKDLVFLQDVMPMRFSFAMLKGKNNYLCLKREREFTELSEQYIKFRAWISCTETGDKDELDFIPEFWAKICGDSNDCGVSQCPFYNDCFYYRHFKDLYRKDIIVVNHHLLMYDLLSGFKILPFHDQLVIDEAHQIENVISHVLGSTLNHPQVVWLLYRLRGLKIAVDHLFEHVDMFFKRMDAPLQTAPVHEAIVEELINLKGHLGLEKVVSRLTSEKESAMDDELRDRIETTILCVMSLDGIIEDFIKQDNKDKVYYMTTYSNYRRRDDKRTLELKSSLVECQAPFRELMSGYESVVMTSATLTAGGNFNFIKERIGISDSKEMIIGSPFDFKKQALLYLDKKLPSPVKGNNEVFQQKSLKVIEELINSSKGRALVLFTSYSHLRFAEENITINYPFKAQGDMPPARLIEWFRDTRHSVLLATATFWQGIDIKGDDLSLVIIVKMPFGSPGDPVYDERCRRLGERWFGDLALPSAILLLRQGFGRLIRSAEDYGVVAVLDSRLMTSSYGRAVVSSLPEMDIVHDTVEVKKFFDSLPENNKDLPEDHRTYNLGKDDGDVLYTRSSRVTALGTADDPAVIAELINFTRSENGNERRLAASALGKLARRFRPEIYKAVPALEELLKDEKPQVRQYALKALGRIGSLKKDKLQFIIDNPDEKGYNITLAKKLIRA
ncbi:MAG: HEAT repeat domain-containing protein [Nitrospirae bacterium]|nr:HEAT repeat domain-containing protein [Nitrospirota bacterium]